MTLDELMGKLDALRQQCSGDTIVYLLKSGHYCAWDIGGVTLHTIAHTDVQYIDIESLQDEE